MEKHGKQVMVFGVFDLLHDGHRYFLTEARKLGDRLTVVVAPDSAVSSLKGKPPRNPTMKRIEAIEALGLADKVVSGDVSLGNWTAITRYAPDIVALGYDQQELAEALRNFLRTYKKSIEVFSIGPYADGALHSSALSTQKL